MFFYQVGKDEFDVSKICRSIASMADMRGEDQSAGIILVLRQSDTMSRVITYAIKKSPLAFLTTEIYIIQRDGECI